MLLINEVIKNYTDQKELLFTQVAELWKRQDRRKRHGLYIHIPFCRTICHFCNCFSRQGHQNQIQRYLSALYAEIKRTSPLFSGIIFDTLYFGGGTPSILTVRQLNILLRTLGENFNFKGAHFSFECDPFSISKGKIQLLKKYGLTRLTVGVQTFNHAVLKKHNRHIVAPARIKKIINFAKRLGILVNIDLMRGLPWQNNDIVADDLQTIIAMRPNQIQSYHFTKDERISGSLRRKIQEKSRKTKIFDIRPFFDKTPYRKVPGGYLQTLLIQ